MNKPIPILTLALAAAAGCPKNTETERVAAPTRHEQTLTDELERSKLTLGDFLATFGEAQNQVTTTEAALIYSSRREFCLAVTQWASTYQKNLDHYPYYTESTFPADMNYYMPPVGEGPFFQDVVAATIKKGCLTPDERLQFFNDYKLTVLQYRLNDMQKIFAAMESWKYDLLDGDEKAQKRFEQARKNYEAIIHAYEGDRNTTYENVFNDEERKALPPTQKTSAYNEAVRLIDHVQNGGKTPAENLEAISTKKKSVTALWDGEETSPEEKEDLYRAMMLLMDYEIYLISAAVPMERGFVLGSNMTTQGEIVGEGEVDLVFNAPKEVRRFQMPSAATLDVEVGQQAAAQASGDNQWLALAESLFFNRALKDYTDQTYPYAVYPTRYQPFNAIEAWERSLATSRVLFQLEDGYCGQISSDHLDCRRLTYQQQLDGQPGVLFMPELTRGHYAAIVGGLESSYRISQNYIEYQNRTNYLSLFDQLAYHPEEKPSIGDVPQLYCYKADESCRDALEGMRAVWYHLISTYPNSAIEPGTTYDVPVPFLREMAEDYAKDWLSENSNY